MEGQIENLRLSKNSRKLCMMITGALFFLALIAPVPMVIAESNTSIIIDPTFARLLVGENFTMTVNITNVPEIYLWQIVFKYNGTVLNLTELWIPENNIFAGHTIIPVEVPWDTQAPGDFYDNLNWTLYGLSLVGSDKVTSVSNAVLFKANFTVINTGESTIYIATKTNAAYSNSITSFASEYMYGDFLDSVTDFSVKAGTIVSGAGNAKPTASFGTNPSLPDNSTNYIVNGNVPTGVADWKRAYKNYTISFDASESYDPGGNITQYIWDFGDGNITTVNATAMDAPIITHTYNTTGTFTVTLVVMDNGKPSGNPEPLSSAPAKQTILVGLVLPLYNWTPFIYTVLALIAVAIVASAAREILRSVRRRKEIKIQRALLEKPSARPSAGAKSE